jgi:hypothetical protein
MASTLWEYFLPTDSKVVCGLEAFILVVAILAWFKQKFGRKAGGVELAVLRGPESWKLFIGTYGLFSVLCNQVLSLAEEPKRYKAVLALFNAVVLAYLTCGNGWFRNWLVGFVSRAKKKPEL